MKRIYGNQKTNLILTDKAERFYTATDPLSIIEHVHIGEDGEESYTYTVDGCFVYSDPMSADELNAVLEELYNECFEE